MATIRAFMFHDVRDLSETLYPNRYELRSFLSKKEFKHQINVINRDYRIISSGDIENIDLTDDEHDYAVLTFDDGLSDHYYVYQHLKKLKISGTFFVPAAPIIDHKMIHPHKIQFILAVRHEKNLVEEILSNFDNKDEIWDKYSITEWKDNWWSKEMIFITNFLRKHKTETFNCYDYTDYLFVKYVFRSEEEFAKRFYLTLKELEEISNNSMTVGGHGYSSDNLLLVDDIDLDIKRSYTLIKEYSDTFMFSYPNGGVNGEIKDIMKKYNCPLSYTVNPKTITNLDTVDYLEFPRYDAPQKISLK